jgi:hypothetical protein
MAGSTLTEPEAPIRPLVTVRDARLRVEPGQIATTELTVSNQGGIVETYDIAVLGPAAAWVTTDPLSVSLFPGDEQDVTVTFQPPMTSRIVAGEYALGFKVTSQVRPEGTATTESVVTVPPFYRFRIVQAQSAYTVRTKATTLVRVVNEGNSTVTYGVKADDPEGFLSVKPKDPTVTLAPGESRWIEINVKVAPKIIGSGFETRSFIISVTPLHDVDLDLAIVDEDSEEIGASIVHRPFIRVRLGVLGRLILLLSILGLIAGFLISRFLANQPSPQTLAPPIPSDIATSLSANGSDVILTWSPSNGATSYVIYALGPAGDPVPPAPQPVIVEAPVGSAAARGVGVPRVEIDLELDIPTPVCEDCTLIAEVETGTTRHVVESVPAGVACYRLAAKRGELHSLFSPKECVDVPGIVDINDNGIPDIDESGVAAILPCPPMATVARPVSGSTIAITWKPSEVAPAGFLPPDAPGAAAALAAASMAGSEGAAAADTTLRGGPIGPDKDGSPGKPVRVCDPAQVVTGWALQRKIFTGWSNVDPAPAAQDTATEVRDLEPGRRYCFRMGSVSAQGESEYSKRFCTTTQMSAAPDVPAPAAAPSTSTPAPAAVDPTGAAPTAPARVIIENLR